jgi:hypothetical protein
LELVYPLLLDSIDFFVELKVVKVFFLADRHFIFLDNLRLEHISDNVVSLDELANGIL